MLFLFKAVVSQVTFLTAMVLTQSRTGQKEGGKQGHQISTSPLLSRDEPLISSSNLHLLWGKVSKRYNSEMFPFSCEYKISSAKWNIFKHLCCSRAVNTSRNTSTLSDYFAHSSAPLSSTGTKKWWSLCCHSFCMAVYEDTVQKVDSPET